MTDFAKEVLPIDLEVEMQQSYLDYAMSVIVSRAIPDLRDGLKPVHRRILYAMHETNNSHDKAYRKSARPVGDVMGKYHPHGDTAVYDTIVRMAQDFSMRLPLLDGQGNFGSMDGDPPAAMRYTEVRMDKPAAAILEDIEKETVDYQDNYDGKDQEPSVLPARFPNMLVNGAGGIAVGMATNIPPHNLGEVVDATLALIDEPDLTSELLIESVPGPDFPTGGFIMGRDSIHQAYRTGRGIIPMRAKAMVEQLEDGKVDTGHTTSPVPFVYLEAGTEPDESITNDFSEVKGSLVNVAPTALPILGLDIPSEMNVEPIFARKPDQALAFGIETLARCFEDVPSDVTRTMHMCCGYPSKLDDHDYPKAAQDSYAQIAQRVDGLTVRRLSTHVRAKLSKVTLL